jgi:SagB-type dehydrogenase family enzyme
MNDRLATLPVGGETPSRKKHLSRITYDLADLSLMECFHEATKYWSETIDADLPRIMAYLTEQRAMLEVTRNRKNYRYSPRIRLPAPRPCSATLEKCLAQRRTFHEYAAAPVALATVASVLFDALAPTREFLLSKEHDYRLKVRPYASGGGLYPIEIYPMLFNVGDLPALVTHYDPLKHCLDVISPSTREEILSACNDVGGQLAAAAGVIVLTGVLERTTVKYGLRGYRFALLETGEIAQNLSLCAVAHRLGTLPWGGYDDDRVADLLHIDNVGEVVFHCMAFGEPTA